MTHNPHCPSLISEPLLAAAVRVLPTSSLSLSLPQPSVPHTAAAATHPPPLTPAIQPHWSCMQKLNTPLNSCPNSPCPTSRASSAHLQRREHRPVFRTGHWLRRSMRTNCAQICARPSRVTLSYPATLPWKYRRIVETRAALFLDCCLVFRCKPPSQCQGLTRQTSRQTLEWDSGIYLSTINLWGEAAAVFAANAHRPLIGLNVGYRVTCWVSVEKISRSWLWY